MIAAGLVMCMHLLLLGGRGLVGVVVGDLVFQLVVRQEVQRGSLHLQGASAGAAGGEGDGPAASVGGGDQVEVNTWSQKDLKNKKRLIFYPTSSFLLFLSWEKITPETGRGADDFL